MDYTITPVPRRSLVRRLAPWAASLGLFAGGGFGVYRYALPTAASAEAATPDAALDASQNRMLAAVPSRGAAAATTGRYLTPFDAPADRYGAAPALPPAPDDEEVDTPRSADSVQPPINPFGAMPAGGSRYGGAAPAATSATSIAAPPEGAGVVGPASMAPPADAAGEPESTSVARGQEPGANPLRTSGSAPSAAPATEAMPDPADDAEDLGGARAAFSEGAGDPSISPPAELIAYPGARYAAGQSAPAPMSAPEPAVADASYGAAAPLPASNPFAAAASSRRGSVASEPASPPLPPYASPSYGAPTAALEPTPAAEPSPGYAAAALPASEAITPTPGLATADGTGRPGERILEGMQTPALTVQKSAPPEIQVGKKATFYIRVTNTSQRTAHRVQVLDEVPLGTQLIGTAPKANVSGAQVSWDLGTLGAGEERIVEMELMPTAEGEIGSVATVMFASQASAKTRCTRPQLALRLSANPRVMIGDKQIVQVEISNPGSGDATGVMLLENIPAGVTHEAGPALEFEVGTLHPGETQRLELVLTADQAGLIDNVMTARGDANLQVQANCQFEVIAPELKLSVDGPAKRILERQATYQVTVDNPGTAAARDVQLVTQLPKGMKFVSANNHGEYDPTTHSVYWSLPELPANVQGTVELTTLAIEAGEQTLQVATRAQQGLEDRTETRVLVEGIVALGFEVHDTVDAIQVGDETSYEIRVKNQGSKTATNVQVVASMPPGLRPHAGAGEARYTVQGDRVVFAPIPQLAPKADVLLQFRVQGLRAGDQRVTLQVVTDEVREPIIAVESTQVFADE
jgi:uncharacterized repeat protein (TIGR01451 family)